MSTVKVPPVTSRPKLQEVSQLASPVTDIVHVFLPELVIGGSIAPAPR